MKSQIRKCDKCYRYSLKNICTYCKNQTVSCHPAKFSPDDKYLRYRIPDNYN